MKAQNRLKKAEKDAAAAAAAGGALPLADRVCRECGRRKQEISGDVCDCPLELSSSRPGHWSSVDRVQRPKTPPCHRKVKEQADAVFAQICDAGTVLGLQQKFAREEAIGFPRLLA
jgi:hypothetical protein